MVYTNTEAQRCACHCQTLNNLLMKNENDQNPVMQDEWYTSLIDKIYSSLMSMPGVGMGEMGEARDEATRIVDEWMSENKIGTK